MKKINSYLRRNLFISFFCLILSSSLLIFPKTALTQTIKIQHIIFDDTWKNAWSDGSEKAVLNPKYDEWIHTGTYAIAATLKKGGALIFKREIPIDIKNYTGIAGFINGGESGKQIIGICVIDDTGTRRPNDLGLDLRKYIQGGSFPIDDWKTFAIPFSHFGNLPKGIKGICFVNASQEDAPTFIIDNFGLVDFVISAPSSSTSISSTKQPQTLQLKKKEVSLIFSDKFENMWEDWSWKGKLLIYDKSSSSGKLSLFAYQDINGAVAFGTKAPFNTKGYEALEFMINGGDRDNQEIGISLYDASGVEIRRNIKINNKEYIENGSLSANQWKKVRIPLSRMRAQNIKISKIALTNNSGEEQAFLIDDVMFVK